MRTSKHAFWARVYGRVLWQRIRMHQAREVYGEFGRFFVQQCNEQLVMSEIYRQVFKPCL